ncbi:MAG: 8-oxo-dGTP diphosphatase MutT [Polymorphobacter sp.]
MKRIVNVVAVALIDADNCILMAQRPEGKSLAGLWEFPGGKIEADETPEAALVRELAEELGIVVAEDALQAFSFVSHAYPDFHLLMLLYICRRWTGTPDGRDGQALTWGPVSELSALPMPPADLPLLAALRREGY